MIRLHLFSSRQLTDSNEPFRASLELTELLRTGRCERARARATDAGKSKLLMSNYRINYCNKIIFRSKLSVVGELNLL